MDQCGPRTEYSKDYRGGRKQFEGVMGTFFLLWLNQRLNLRPCAELYPQPFII